MTYFSNGKDVSLAEQGTFTPKLQDASFSDAEGQVHVTQDGRFTKIGSVVFFEFRIVMSSLGTLTGAGEVNVAGFPFPIVGDISTAIVGQAVGLNLPGAFSLTGRFDSATQTMRIMMLNQIGGHASITIVQTTSDADFKFSGSYRTN